MRFIMWRKLALRPGKKKLSLGKRWWNFNIVFDLRKS